MEQRIIINLGQGSWQSGFPTVIVQLWELDSTVPMQLIGRLPAASGLALLYERWQSYYRALNSNLGLRQLRSGTTIEIESDDITHVSRPEFEALCHKLKRQFNAWLSVNSFVNVERQLRTHLDASEQIQLIVEAEDLWVCRFPWHLWSFLEDYRQAEVAIGALEHKKVKRTLRSARSKIRVLSVLGDSTGIQVAKDRDLLEQLTDVDPTVLDEPLRHSLDEHLWDEAGWDVLFFAGHSSSQLTEGHGYIKINALEDLSISQLKHGLQTAIDRGLQLAIFNSCDGMGLAKELSDLHIPYLIVMREPVPDQVAQLFLMNFLRAFATGIPFYSAMREARERLQGMEGQFPCASWLPVICQNPTAESLTWQLLKGQGDQSIVRVRSTQSSVMGRRGKPKLSGVKRFGIAVLVGLLVGSLVIGVRSQGILQPFELSAYDHMMRLRPEPDGKDNQIVVVTVDQEDIEHQRSQEFTGGEATLKDEALLNVMQKLEPAEPKIIGLDIQHDFPFIPELTKRLNEQKNFVAVCRIGAPESNLQSFGPPDATFPIEQLGFTNFPQDDDGKIRRQLLGMKPGEICPADQSLSLRIALQYFDLQPDFIDENHVRLGDLVIRKLDRYSGGYSLPPGEDGGYQILTNYRSRQPDKISLSELLILEAPRISERVRGKIVLIGGDDGKHDQHGTPYSRDRLSTLSGVFVHAQMISHLINAMQDKRPLIRWWPQWIENVWILAWTLGGASLVLLMRDWVSKRLLFTILTIIIVQALLYGICFVCFEKALWIPWIPTCLGSSLAALSCFFYFQARSEGVLE